MKKFGMDDYREVMDNIDYTTFNRLYEIYKKYGRPDNFEDELPEKIDGVESWKIVEAIRFELDLKDYNESIDMKKEQVLYVTCDEAIKIIDETGAKFADFREYPVNHLWALEAYLSYDIEMEDVQCLKFLLTDSDNIDNYNKIMRYIGIKEIIGG